jgi:hypothetical protein
VSDLSFFLNKEQAEKVVSRKPLSKIPKHTELKFIIVSFERTKALSLKSKKIETQKGFGGNQSLFAKMAT